MLLDATFDYSWDDANNSKPSKSHYYVNDKNFLNTARPKNWTTPVDYRNGTVHVRAEVLQKPAGNQQVGWVLCYIANEGDYGCTGSKYYKSTGVFENDQKMTDFWQNETIEWDQGIKQMDLVYTINDSGSGHVHYFPELKDATTPTRVRITMVQVSAGSTYDPSILNGTGGTAGAGGMPSGGASGGGAGGTPAMTGGAGGSSAGTGGAGGSLSTGGSGGGAAGGPSVGGTPGSSAGAGGVGGGGGVMAGAAGASPSTSDTTPETVAGCAMSPGALRSERWSGLAAALAALGLAMRTRRLMRR